MSDEESIRPVMFRDSARLYAYKLIQLHNGVLKRVNVVRPLGIWTLTPQFL